MTIKTYVTIFVFQDPDQTFYVSEDEVSSPVSQVSPINIPSPHGTRVGLSKFQPFFSIFKID